MYIDLTTLTSPVDLAIAVHPTLTLKQVLILAHALEHTHLTTSTSANDPGNVNEDVNENTGSGVYNDPEVEDLVEYLWIKAQAAYRDNKQGSRYFDAINATYQSQPQDKSNPDTTPNP